MCVCVIIAMCVECENNMHMQTCTIALVQQCVAMGYVYYVHIYAYSYTRIHTQSRKAAEEERLSEVMESESLSL